MDVVLDPHRSPAALATGAALAGLSLRGLALLCAGVGDVVSGDHVAWLTWSAAPRSAYEHDVMAVALDDYLCEQGLSRPVAVSTDCSSGTAPEGS